MIDTLLIIEDEKLLGTEMSRYFERQGWDVDLYSTIEDAKNALLNEDVEPLVVLSDLNLPDGNGLDLLEEVRKHRHAGEWVFLTAYGSVPESVRAVRLGAFDFLEKPCDLDRLNLVVSGATRSAQAQRRLKEENKVQSQRYSVESYLGSSKAAQNVRDMLQRLSQVPFSALIIDGETGSGKGLAARILHHCSNRSEGPLIEINCAALPHELLESELFGHEAGAFTGAKNKRRGLFEQAHGGTLFLDEIGELDLELQSKLLKAIEDRKVRRLGGEKELNIDVQVIVATNLDLQKQIAQGKFRADLYHRLSVFNLRLPSLSERKEDLHELVPVLIREFNSKAHKTVEHISSAVWKRLFDHDWPGNVRELRNAIERCVLFSTDQNFPIEWLLSSPNTSSNTDAGNPDIQVNHNTLTIPIDGSMALDDMDRFIIKTTLERCKFNVTAAARLLGTTRETLRYRIQKYNLMVKEESA